MVLSPCHHQRINRRKFVAVSGLGALVSPTVAALAQTPQVLTRRSAPPLVVASANGNKSKDAEGLTCVARAFHAIAGGADVLDALIAGGQILSLGPPAKQKATHARVR